MIRRERLSFVLRPADPALAGRFGMRARVMVFLAVLLTALPAAAQKFREPTKDELQMTLDPKAPGAPAVYLDREDETDFGSYYVSKYARIKILTEEGKAWARVEITYDPAVFLAPIIEGRTVHPDGAISVLPKPAPPQSLSDESAAKLATIVFTLPDATVGSILEYRYTLRLGPRPFPHARAGSNFLPPHFYNPFAIVSPRWEVQERIYTHHARFTFDSVPLSEKIDSDTHSLRTWDVPYVDGERAGNLSHVDRLPTGLSVARSTIGVFTLEAEDIPALQDEPWALPEASRAYHVQFFYAPYPLPDPYWKSEIKRWSSDLASDTEATAKLREVAAGIIGSATTPEEKARRLYAAVQALNNTDFTRDESRTHRRTYFQFLPQKPDKVWDAKIGSSNEIAGLYLALSKSAGLDAYGIAVTDRSRSIFNRNYLSLDQLDALLVGMHIGGKEVILDPGEKFCPFGQLAWYHTLTSGISQAAQDIIQTPAGSVKDSVIARTVDLTVNPDGRVTGTLKVLMRGPEALHWRQFALSSDIPTAQSQFSRLLQAALPPNIEVEPAQFKGLETSDGDLEAIVNLAGPLGSLTGKSIALPSFLFSVGSQGEFVAENRTSPIDLHFAGQVIDDVKFHLPPGYSVNPAPPVQIAWPGNAAQSVTAAIGPGTVEVKHIFARTVSVVDPKDYTSLRDFYRKIAAIDSKQIELVPDSASQN